MNFSVTPKWGIRVFAAWAFVLTILALAHLLILSAAVELYSNLNNNQAQVWFIFVLNVAFAVGFAASSYGLWQQQNWGRVMFLWAVVIWSGFNFLGLFVPGLMSSTVGQTTLQTATNGARYLAGLIIPVWYFNLPHIKTFFLDSSISSEETNNV